MAGLLGMKQITDYVSRSEVTVLKLHREYGFPAVKIGGTWESDTELIDKWRRTIIESHRETGID